MFTECSCQGRIEQLHHEAQQHAMLKSLPHLSLRQRLAEVLHRLAAQLEPMPSPSAVKPLRSQP